MSTKMRLFALSFCITMILSSCALIATPSDKQRKFFNVPDAYETTQIIIYKQERELELYADETCIGVFSIALGREPIGTKNEKGDYKTPEGEYYICTRHDKTDYVLFLGLSYPNLADAQKHFDNGAIDSDTFDMIKTAIEQEEQPPWETALGGKIGIHGGGNARDWTEGCISVSNEDLDIIREYTPLNTPVTIYASRDDAY